jgi:hypothetical protein
MSVVRRGRLLVAGVIWLGIGGLSAQAWAAPKAWLINEDGDAVKLDLTQQELAETVDLGTVWILLGQMGVDRARGNLFVPHGRGPYKLAVFDLKTLKPKGALGFEVDDAPTGPAEAVRFVFPPAGGTVFARHWNPAVKDEAKAIEVVGIDATTFEAAAPRTTSPPLAEKLMLDAAGRQLYSITSRKPARIDVFDVPALTHRSAIDLEPFLNPKAFGRGIFDFADGKILVAENEKAARQEPGRYTLFVFDAATGRISPKVRTGLMGDGALLPRTNRLVFNEKKTAQPGAKADRPGAALASPGTVHVYDTATGNRLATVQVPLDPGTQWGRVLDVSPAEDFLYYLVPRPGRKTPKLAVVSLRTFAVVKELVLPYSGPRMIVFDE